MATSAFSNKETHQPPALYGRAKYGRSKYGKTTAAEIRTAWDNKSKNAAALTNKTKN